MTHRQSPRRAGRIDAAAPETLTSHAYFPCDKGGSRVCAAATLVSSLNLAPAFARGGGGPVGAHFAGRGFGRAIRSALRRAGSTRISDLTASASIASARSGLAVLAPTGLAASSLTGSIASGPAGLAATSFSSAAGAVGAGAASPLRPLSQSSWATARRSSSTLGPIPLQAPPLRDTQGLASSTS